MPECSPPSLVIRLFGPLVVLRDGQPLPRLRSRKGHWLLALLVLRAGRESERDWLATLLWPDSAPFRAAQSLRMSLKALRQALGPAASRLRSPSPRTLSLDLEGAVVDLLAFDEAVARGDEASLEQAVSLYREPLLEGCAEAWAFEERQAREQACLAALEQLAARALSRRDREAAERHLRRAVALDPVRESAQRALMQLLGEGGQFAAATQVYRELRLLLHRELNAEPDGETQALFHRLRTLAHARSRDLPQTQPVPPDAAGRPPTGSRTPAHDEREGWRPSHPLPHPPSGAARRSALIGRQEEMAAVRELLLREDVGLVTLTGAAGSGKTRLALELAAELGPAFRDGVFFVPLAPIADPNLVPGTILQALAIPATGNRSMEEILQDWLRDRHILLVLDNFEQVVAAAPRLAELLATSPWLKLLVTSRTVLRLREEYEFTVPPLAVPDPSRSLPVEAVARYPAVALFVRRAGQVKQGFCLSDENAASVAEICRRLDGLPLALELAAARIKLFAPEALLARLENRLAFLVGGARDLPARQRTLRDAIAWSYDLLPQAEQWLFRRLAVFVGGCTLDAVEAVVSADSGPDPLAGMASLVDHNLVQQEQVDEGEPRFSMLETVREYAGERLAECGEAEEARRRHAGYFVALAEELHARHRAGDADIPLDQIEREHDNLRAALRWLLTAGEAETSLRLSGSLWFFWGGLGHWSEAREWLARALALPQPVGPTLARAYALVAAGAMASNQGEHETARLHYRECVTIARQFEDLYLVPLVINNLGLVATHQGDYAEARQLFEEAVGINQRTGNRRWLAANFGNLGDIAMHEGDYSRARALFEQAHAAEPRWSTLWGVLSSLGAVALREGDYAAARELFEQDLRVHEQRKSKRLIADALHNLGDVACCQRDHAAARSFYRRSLTMWRELGERRAIASSLEAFALLALAEAQAGDPGRWSRSARLLAAAEALRTALGAALPPVHRGEWERGVAAVEAALGAEALVAGWAEGRAMSLDEAICCALEI